jgi:hypothetical protein
MFSNSWSKDWVYAGRQSRRAGRESGREGLCQRKQQFSVRDKLAGDKAGAVRAAPLVCVVTRSRARPDI